MIDTAANRDNSSFSNAVNSQFIPTPSKEFFVEALVDKEKEELVFSYLKARFRPAIDRMLMVSEVQGMGLADKEEELLRRLMKSAVSNPRAFNFE